MKVKQKVKIGVFGDGAWAANLVLLLNQIPNYEVCFVVKRFTTDDDDLEQRAKEHGIPLFEVENVNTPEALELFSSFQADVYLSMSFDQIIRGELLATSRLGFLNCHAGRLPFYRGRNALNWAIINGEKEFGITVHVVDEGIDTGPIVLQHSSPIGLREAYADVLERAHQMCPETMLKALKKYLADPTSLIDQKKHFKSQSYFSKRMVGDEWIDWGRSSAEIYNLIRGISKPGPCARTILDGKTIAIIEAELVSGFADYLGTCGQIIGKQKTGVLVKTGDNVLLIKKYSILETNGILGETKTADMTVGALFGYRINHEINEINKKIAELQSLIGKWSDGP